MCPITPNDQKTEQIRTIHLANPAPRLCTKIPITSYSPAREWQEYAELHD